MSMYIYTDTTRAASLPATGRSAESLQIDGTWLEDVIPGFRVLYTRGREALPLDITTLTIPTRDGEYVTGKRYPARQIVVGYRLVTGSPQAFRAAFNSLFSYIRGEHRLVFADEADKFYTGAYQDASSGEPGTDTAVGELVFFCADPFKYSIEEHSQETLLRPVPGSDGVTRNLRSFLVNYQGTVPARPRFETRFFQPNNAVSQDTVPSNAGDCGYIAFMDQDGHVLQFGDPDEADGASYDKSQLMLDTVLYNKSSWTSPTKGTASSGLWRPNTGYADPDVTAMGSMRSDYSQQVTAEEQAAESAGTLDGLRYLTPQSYGTATATGWHGPTISARLPAMPVGTSSVRGAADWRLYFRAKIGASDDPQMGLFKADITTSSGALIASIAIKKHSSSMTGKVIVTFGGKTKTKSVDLSYYNRAFGAGGRHTCILTKTQNRLVVDYGDETITLKDTSTTSMLADRVTFCLASYRKNERASTEKEIDPLARNGLYNVKFTKLNCPTWADVPNKFSSGDVLKADTRDASILLNDAPAADLGALGSDWENFVLVPGEQYIVESRSSWTMGDGAQYRPHSTIYWRDTYA